MARRSLPFLCGILFALPVFSAALAPPAAADHYPTLEMIDVWSYDIPAIRSGSGTHDDPYVISQWTRDISSGGNGTNIGNNDAYIVVRELHVIGDFAGGPHLQCCRGNSWQDVYNLTFRDSLVEGVRIGTYLWNGHDILIVNNTFNDSVGMGIQVGGSARVEISGNTFTGRGANVRIYDSSDVRIFHNNFMEHSYQSDDETPGHNQWDDGYPSGGNYWSNYTGVDECKGEHQDDCSGPDGIGDSPYGWGGLLDHYPLMAPFEHGPANAAPSASLSVSPATPNVNATVTFDASASSDPEDGYLGLEFRFDLDGDGTYEADWASGGNATTTFATAGERTLAVQVRDSHGASATASATIVVADPNATDTHPAEATSTSEASASSEATVTVEAEVTDPDGVASVQVIYQGVGASSFAPIPMDKTGTNTYRATLPAQRAAGVVEYYILVTDTHGHQTRSPDQGTHQVTITQRPTAAAPDALPLAILTVVAVSAGVFLLQRRMRR